MSRNGLEAVGDLALMPAFVVLGGLAAIVFMPLTGIFVFALIFGEWRLAIAALVAACVAVRVVTRSIEGMNLPSLSALAEVVAWTFVMAGGAWWWSWA